MKTDKQNGRRHGEKKYLQRRSLLAAHHMVHQSPLKVDGKVSNKSKLNSI